MSECSILEPNTLFKLDETGIWGEAVRQRKEIIINDFQAANPLKKGYPKKHATLYKYMTVNKETMKILQDYSWPGNVRELESDIEKAAILSPGPDPDGQT